MKENYLLKMLNQLANSKLIKRWQSESPDFWKGIQKYSIVIGSGAVAIISADKLFGLIAYGEYIYYLWIYNCSLCSFWFKC